MKKFTIGLAGNPNSGKTTLFNLLTGSEQKVGNWPGVTVERKEGVYRKDANITVVDLPGIYSLSPYTLEEIVSRDYLVDNNPDVIVNIIDATNLERNLYLTTQLLELKIPVVIALNMMDLVDKSGEKILTEELEDHFGCKVIKISALKKTGVEELIKACESSVGTEVKELKLFDDIVENYINRIMNLSDKIDYHDRKRWIAIKLLENDSKIIEKIGLDSEEIKSLNIILREFEDKFDDDGEGIIINGRYNFVSDITKHILKNKRLGLSTTEKIDKIFTSKFLALPIFAIIMTGIYYIAMVVVGGAVTDWVNDIFFGEIIQENTMIFLTNIGTAPWLVSLIGNGIIGGVGAVIGFLPIIITLYIFIALLEDIGYMSRIAFILDRIFRKFGLSGKSFIPILMGIGCSVPGIMGTRTIESEKDRKMTIIVTSFMPCGAKSEIIALFAASVFVGKWWFAPICYFIGIIAVILSGIILKKTTAFSGETAPFVMELPPYHIPEMKNIAKVTLQRVKAFFINAGTIILIATIFVWFLQNISISGEFAEFEENTNSLLEALGKFLAPLFAPLGFGNWLATVSTFLGLLAKEMVVSTYGLVAGIGADLGANSSEMVDFTNLAFTSVSAMSFMIFNQLTIPCFAAVGAIISEMGSRKWSAFALIYQVLFSYTMALMVYQFGRILVLGENFTPWTVVALVVLVIYLFLLFRPNKRQLKKKNLSKAIHS